MRSSIAIKIMPNQKENDSNKSPDNVNRAREKYLGRSIMNLPIMNIRTNKKQTVFKLFGFEMTAPEGLRNPGLIYTLFILVNLVIFVLLKNQLT